MTTPPQPTGRRDHPADDWIVFTRRFTAPIDDVWAAVTEPDRMARWISTWTGDPASGHVDFFMTAEGEDDHARVRPVRRLLPGPVEPLPRPARLT